jgi:hypothetical protein
MMVDGPLNLIGEKQPDVLCLSVAPGSYIGQFKEPVKKTLARFPGWSVLTGGQAFPRKTAEAGVTQTSDFRVRWMK